jgi:BirA family biotin operon repressor/biotin-[acetyl-CoA-carboxylase] ligase
VSAGVRWHDSVASTLDAVHTLAAAGAPHGAAVAARIQTSGRGTRGRGWISGDGGLWMSVVCRPWDVVAIETVGIRVGLGLADYLDRLLPARTRVSIKWPNDLFLDDGKVGGILSEARWQGGTLAWLAVGVGINVTNELPVEIARRAVRLADFGVIAMPADLAEPVAAIVARAAEVAAPLTPNEVEHFHARDWLRGRALAQPEPGIAEGITRGGRLRVRKGDGALAEVFGSVQLAAGGR